MYSKSSQLFIYVLLVVFAVLPLVAGLGFAVLYSFDLTGVLNHGFTTEHWSKVFSDGNALQSFFYSSGIALVSVLLSVVIALTLSLQYHRRFRKGVLSYLVYMPLAFPGIVAAFFFFQLLTKSGIVSRLLFQLHLISSIDQFPDLVNDTYGIGIIITNVFLSLPFFILLFVNIIKTEQVTEYQQLAATYGAGKWQTLMKVSVPMLLQKALPNIILYFIFIFGAFEIPLLLGRSDPEMVSVLAVRKLQRFNLLDIPQGYAIAVLYTLFVSLLLVLLFKLKAANEKA